MTALPSLPELSNFPTVGPDGVGTADINGRAAAIECYLDLNFGLTQPAQVRWTAYNERADAYQGSLANKQFVAKRFLDLRLPNPAYDFSKIRAVLDHLIGVCFSVGEQLRVQEAARVVGD